MLLNAASALARRVLRRAVPSTDHESGAAMATVVGLVLVTVIVSTTLASMAVFATGFTTSNRAAVQARAAAEGGIDVARSDLLSSTVCRTQTTPGEPGRVQSKDDLVPQLVHSTPRFDVEVSFRRSTAPTDAWIAGCPDRRAVEVRLLSTGTAANAGVAEQSGGDRKAVDSIYRGTAPEFPHAVKTEAAIRAGGHLTPNRDPGVAPEQAAFPLVSVADPRWRAFTAASPSDLARLVGAGSTDGCTVGGSGPARVVEVRTALKVDATGCGSGFTLTSGQGLELKLWKDMVIFAGKLTVEGPLTVSTGDGKPRTLYLVRPWTRSPQAPCETGSAGEQMTIGGGGGVGKSIITKDQARVMLYSSTHLYLGAPTGTPLDQDFAGQVYGCVLTIKDKVMLSYAPATATILGYAPRPATRAVSQRDVPVGTR